MNRPTEDVAHSLVEAIGRHPSVVVAFSGGVDSAVVAAAAFLALGPKAVAVTGLGPAVASSELEGGRAVAKSIGIRHVEIETHEILDANYVRNDGSRCYHCKSNLYGTLRNWAEQNGFKVVLSGTNQDDLGDYRPGLQAADENAVQAPLVELAINKNLVRELASYFGLGIADKPASPCLASRIAYGQSVTESRLKKIEKGELFLRELGFEDVRVRLHSDELVRLEIGLEDIPQVCDRDVSASIQKFMHGLGFKFVTLDLAGRQTGSLNRSLPILQ